MFKRVYIQYQPINLGKATIIELINLAYRSDIAARPMPSEQIHLTIIHFGSLEATYKDLLVHNETLSQAGFGAAVEQFATACQQACSPVLTVQPTQFAHYGSNKQTLVLECAATDALITAHQTCLVALRTLFKDCGVSDVDAFMANHHNFKHALTLRPHITLLKNAQKPQQLEVPEALLELQLMKIRYNGYTGTE